MQQEKKVEELLEDLGFEDASRPYINEYSSEYIYDLLKELQRLKKLERKKREGEKVTEKCVFKLSHKGNATKTNKVNTADEHVMFKLIMNNEEDEYNEEEGTKTIAWVKDGNKLLYGYEFLIEFDVHDFGYGIYYGCKTIIPDGKSEEEVAKQIKSIKEKWGNSLKGELTTVLTNIFEGISFEKKLIPTTNANNNTFWPFWIRLNENEDIIEVAAMATLFIARFCLAKIKTNCELKELPKTTDLNLDAFFADKKKKPIYYFTEKCWEEIKKNDESIKTIQNVQEKLNSAIEVLVQKGILTQKLEYEYAWQFEPGYEIPITKDDYKDGSKYDSKYNKIALNNIVCIHLIKFLWDALRGETLENNQEKTKQKNTYLLNQIWLMPSGEICNNPGHTMQNRLKKSPVIESDVIKNHLNKTLEK